MQGDLRVGILPRMCVPHVPYGDRTLSDAKASALDGREQRLVDGVAVPHPPHSGEETDGSGHEIAGSSGGLTVQLAGQRWLRNIAIGKVVADAEDKGGCRVTFQCTDEVVLGDLTQDFIGIE